ncbi:hypothetical protein [Acetobacter tropicalis]|uniref:Uncharacterized protein n=1 Tax=Acetobacter tropicalis TaxID=104102 RepID=A0A511FRX4_9PROT|nr:hypothetical protein [Acetobacter tropicalis]GEL51707.1 hypothetical protein ATR01nite_27820 [Acetobacter tropicalis]
MSGYKKGGTSHHGRVPHMEDPHFVHAAPEHYEEYKQHLEAVQKIQKETGGGSKKVAEAGINQ